MSDDAHHSSTVSEEALAASDGETRSRQRPRRPWLAGLLSAICPGLGQLYDGRPGRALIYLALSFPAFLLTCWLLVATHSLVPLWLGMAAIVGVWLAGIIEAARTAQRLQSYRLRRFNRVLVYVAYGLAVSLAQDSTREYIKSHWLRAFRNPAESMKPTLLPGDYVLSDLRNVSRPQHGDLLVFNYPPQPDKQFLKRVIGLPGDRIEVANKVLSVNGRRVEEPYVIHEDSYVRPAGDDVRDYMSTVVPVRTVFVMGDNRDNSNDSRYFGPVPRDHLLARPFVIYWSWDAQAGRVRWERIGRKVQ